MSDESSAIKVIDVMGTLFKNTSDNPPWKCEAFNEHPELTKLQGALYKESFYQLESDTGVKIPAYQRDIGTYDEPEIEILTVKEWLALPNRPARIDELNNEISKAKDAEYFTGIRHYKSFSCWGPASVMAQKIPVEELKINYEVALKK